MRLISDAEQEEAVVQKNIISFKKWCVHCKVTTNAKREIFFYLNKTQKRIDDKGKWDRQEFLKCLKCGRYF